MNKTLFSKSERFNSEYCCAIVQIGEVLPVENSDRLEKAMVNGRYVIFSKGTVNPGDVMFYADMETELNAAFLAANNQYRDVTLNADDNGQAGFFEANCRVRMIKLRGSYSMGYLFTKDQMAKYNPKVAEVDLVGLVGESFDMVGDEVFIKMYVPSIKESGASHEKNHNNKKIKRYDKLVEGEFSFHYDTQPLYKCMDRFTPYQDITITRKIHGTSAIFSRTKIKQPKRFNLGISFIDDLLNKYVPMSWRKEEIVYGNLYASRSVIKNRYINEKANDGFYGTDVWAEYNALLSPFIPNGWTLYGEIVGYVTGSQTMIQKDYDYGCEPGENKFMLYRIVDQDKNELSVSQVDAWMRAVVDHNPDIAPKIMFLDIVYQGKFGNLYTIQFQNEKQWRADVLEAMKADSKRFFLELDEPLCKHRVPAEGIVIRIEDDPLKEAFKLKADKFFNREAKLVDAGEVDIEMQNGVAEELERISGNVMLDK